MLASKLNGTLNSFLGSSWAALQVLLCSVPELFFRDLLVARRGEGPWQPRLILLVAVWDKHTILSTVVSLLRCGQQLLTIVLW
jgi:hypothetical protein